MLTLIFYSLIGGLFSLIGGFMLILNPKIVKILTTPLYAFSAGAFLAVAFLDLLPEALEEVSEAHPIFYSLLIGFVVFFILERVLMTRFTKEHNEESRHEEHTESLPTIMILGDSIHNFFDGIVIALSFLADPTLGLAATIAIAAHEIPQEIGDFSILLSLGWKKSKVIAINILQSLITIPGVILGYYMGDLFEPQLPYLLAGAAGIFIYISASDLIPHVHHLSGHKHFKAVVIPLLLGILLVGYLTNLSHPH
jgi:zinc and cadmium transporter